MSGETVEAKQLLSQAVALIVEQIESPVQIHPRPGWVRDATIVRDEYDRFLHPLVMVKGVPQDRPTRWRPIDSAGTVSPNPAPETPDDPDEGETGPAEVKL